MKTAELTTAALTSLKEHVSTIAPGLPQTLHLSATAGDAIAQGDLMIVCIGGPPAWYDKAPESPRSDKARQLAPDDGGPGSSHRLSSWDGVDSLRFPPNWGTNVTDLEGPVMRLTAPVEIAHHGPQPHGTVTIEVDPGQPRWIGIRYQRSLTVDRMAERSRD